MLNFDSINTSLDGITIVEAAAGTGKTYNIQNLVVRLIVEKEIPIEEILILTYTKAAAAELKSRIHAALTFTLAEAMDQEVEKKEKQRAEALLAKVDKLRAKVLLKNALMNFDNSIIGTIHSFCNRVLKDYAFECGEFFNSEILKDWSIYKDTVYSDFLRNFNYQQNLSLAHKSLRLACDLEKGDIFKAVENRALKIIPQEVSSADEIVCRYEKLLAEVIEVAPAIGVLMGHLNKRSFKDEQLLGFTEMMSSQEFTFKELAKYSAENIISKALKSSRSFVESWVLVDQNATLLANIAKVEGCFADYKARTVLDAIAFVSSELDRIKCDTRQMSYDDILMRVHSALSQPESRLLRKLQETLKVGIVDEFQDNDKIQYEIFKLIFTQSSNHSLFMVGDPRQAIYGFRGGDLATYFRACSELDAKKYGLTTNYRSSGAIIEAINRVFAEHENPFAHVQITFDAISSPEPPIGSLMFEGIADDNPLQLHRLQDASVTNCMEVAADKVLELLNSSWQTPDNSKILPKDIAILVNRNAEGVKMATLLKERGIPAVCTGVSYLFDSDDAQELNQFLKAIYNPAYKANVFNALATSISYFSDKYLVFLRSEAGQKRWARISEKFWYWNSLWQKNSFVKMFNDILTFFYVRARYAKMVNGERKLTNLLQLGDILQQNSHSSMSILLKFLREQIAHPDSEYEQLLETDRAAVTIMTIHKSKGLEFPIVMLPTMFNMKLEESKNGSYHDSEGNLIFDITAKSQEQVITEKFQENLRLIYVAITRAKYRCHIFWGVTPKKLSVLDWLFFTKKPLCEEWREAITANYDEVIEIPEPLDDYYNLPRSEALELYLPELDLQPDNNYAMLSYSSLTPNRRGQETIFDDDDDDENSVEEKGALDIFSVPRGAALGNAWHRLFEKIDFGIAKERIAEQAVAPLLEFGIIKSRREESNILELTSNMLYNVLNAPLTDGAGRSIYLSQVDSKNRISELEFSYRLKKGFSTSDLQQLFLPFLAEWPDWNRVCSGGYFCGFVDLVFRNDNRFYIVDWKSNYLGGNMGSFSGENLKREVINSYYFLQYHIYVLALIKYLRGRLGDFDKGCYEEMFGGVFYLFLRGISPSASGRGVYFDRPEYEFMVALEEIIG